MKIAITLFLILAASGISFANDAYQFEAGLGFDYKKYAEGSAKTYIYSGYGTYNFAPVNTGLHPLKEAAFLEKSSYVDLSLEKNKSKNPDASFDVNGCTLEANGKCLIPSTPLMLSLGVGIDRQKWSILGFSYTTKTYICSIGFGGYIMNELFAEAVYERDMTKNSSSLFSDYNTNIYSFNIKYVKELNENNAVAIEGKYEYSKDDTSDPAKVQRYLIGADFYILPQFGVGGSYEYININKTTIASFGIYDSHVYGIRVIGFPVKSLSLMAGYEKTKVVNKDEGVDSNRIYIQADYRL
jgi:hypothetical protein